MDSNVFGLYNSFGNLFALDFTESNIYKLKETYEELNSPETYDIIYFQGSYYSYKKHRDSIPMEPELPVLKSFFTKQFKKKLKDNNYKFKGKYIAYKLENEISHPFNDIFKLFDGFNFRLVIIDQKIFLCIDPHLVFEIISSIKDLIIKGIEIEDLRDFSVIYPSENQEFKIYGYLLETVLNEEKNNEFYYICKIKNYRNFIVEEIPSNSVYPEPRPELIQKLLNSLNIDFNVIKLQREKSFLSSKTASKDRFSKTLEIVSNLVKDKIFPLKFGKFNINIEAKPIIVRI